MMFSRSSYVESTFSIDGSEAGGSFDGHSVENERDIVIAIRSVVVVVVVDDDVESWGVTLVA